MTAAGEPPIDDEIEAYVLGTLSKEEASAFEARLAASPELRQQVREARAAVWLLAESPPQLAPSPDLRARVLAAARAERDGRTTPPPAADERPAPAPLPLRPRPVEPGERAPARPTAPPRWTIWLAAASLLVALGLGGWNVLLQQQLAQQRTQIERAQVALGTVAGADRIVQMRGVPDQAPEAVSTLALDRDQKRTVLVVTGFPPLPRDKTYQVWVIQNGRPVSAGTFAPESEDTEVTLVIPSDLTGVTRAAITVEPFGGLDAPTGAFVMVGDL